MPNSKPGFASIQIQQENLKMDIQKIISELRAEQEQLTEAIYSLERLAMVHGGRRRGRPPKWMTEAARAAEAPAAVPAPVKTRGRKKRAMPGRKRGSTAKSAEAASGE